MKKLFLLLVILAILSSCGRQEVMVTPIGSGIRIKALNTQDLPLMMGDTVIISRSLAGLRRNEYIILNEFILKESWIRTDSTGIYGIDYYKAVVN